MYFSHFPVSRAVIPKLRSLSVLHSLTWRPGSPVNVYAYFRKTHWFLLDYVTHYMERLEEASGNFPCRLS